MLGLRIQRRICLLLSLCCVSLGVWAQAWPNKPIALVVGSAPGSAPDVYARTIAEPVGRLLGTTVIIDNRAGANANIAAEFVTRTRRWLRAVGACAITNGN